MENNEIIQQVINEIKNDILRNKSFLAEIFRNVELTEKNISPDLILKLMRQLSPNQEAPRPQSNAPKTRKNVARPVAVGTDSIESKIVSDLLEGNNVYLMGKAGTGKTYLAKAIAESVMGQPVYVINCSQWTSPIEIRGGQTIKGYEEGLLIKAWANGGVLILDELPKLDPNTAGLLNDALAEAAKQPIYNDNGTVDFSTIPTITNGRGQKIKKGELCNPEDLGKQYDKLDDEEKGKWKSREEYINYYEVLKFRFCVIATGNTDMMNVGNKYSGNQRQDYSLVDRFAGSYYTIDVDETKEIELTYPYVFKVCNAIRKFLDTVDVLQSISLRTMLNFNRTYEQEMLYKLESPFADDIKSNDGYSISPKSIEDSINSFLSMLDKNFREQLEDFPDFKEARSAKVNETDFIDQFESKYGLNPKTGEPI
jgi:cobaltochelatase CobS